MMKETAEETKVYQVFQNIAADYDKMNDIISLKQHRKWKEDLVRAAAAARPRDILDICTGTGDIAFALAKACPEANIMGLDFSEEMLKTAENRRHGEEGAHLHFCRGSALALPFPDNAFDAITISFGLRNLPDYEKALMEMARVLRPGGRIFCLESSYPTVPAVKPFFRLYFSVLMPLAGKVFAHHRAEYQWLNESTLSFLSKRDLAALITKTGFEDVHYHAYLFGAAACHWAVKQGGNHHDKKQRRHYGDDRL